MPMNQSAPMPMMGQMKGEMMGEQTAPAAKGQAPKTPSDLIASIHENMMALAEIVDRSKVADPQDKQLLASVINGYEKFVQGLGQAPGQPAPAPQAPVAPGKVPYMQGSAQGQPV